MKDCPFCNPPSDRIILESDMLVAIRDEFPVSPGHALLVTRRHVETWDDANMLEQIACIDTIRKVQRAIEREYQPDGYNIGINSGRAAGQTIAHLHWHIIPRYEGDVEDPRGGIRRVIPGKADYWSEE